ncbi:DEAD/DEAH box helicase family protein [Jeotgalibacillus malaysiensis]|uniref:DEAD/DEAH box helicase family protein n=1 Tax=Jeotgalibacillus malaysiensis TaxID=1508404 RepID=UPI00384AB091
MTNVKLITSHLIDELNHLIDQAEEIYLLTAFAMESGVKRILPSLKKAAERGADIRLLTGDYLCITQPKALKSLINELPAAEIRLWQNDGRSFHPKAYLFRFSSGGHVVVGSSNLSASALDGGIEWSLSAASDQEQLFEHSAESFMHLFQHECTVPVNLKTIERYEELFDVFHSSKDIHKVWTQSEEEAVMFGEPEDQDAPVEVFETSIAGEIVPREAQQQALQALTETMDLGYDKAMIVMATGLGKTYLAAFFARQFKRVLFIAHREEILRQAKASFEHVSGEWTTGLLTGTEKQMNEDVIFASVATLSRKHYLDQYHPEIFDLIVVDEFHHAAAVSYQKIINHFRPEFLLGITATPDRNDGKDVFAICDGNEAYNMNFWKAIQNQWLAPFHYYGVYDETDYSKIRWLSSGYDQEQLEQVQLRKGMAEKIYAAWNRHRQTRTIAFCSSIKQAEFLADYFREQGKQVTALHSRSKYSRHQAIKELHEGLLDVIFTVDLFNEGVDIPPVDTLLFVRPTESLTIFTQQLGRGLRLFEGKSHCTVIDLIGNYRNADVKLKVFDQDPSGFERDHKTVIPDMPEGCKVELETNIIDLVKEMGKNRLQVRDRLITELDELTLELGERPSYLQFHRMASIPSIFIKRTFGSYVYLLKSAGKLTEVEERAADLYKDWFIEAEKTGMVKSYKMVVLLAMLERGPESWFKPVTAEEIAYSFHHYLTEKKYRKVIDFSDKKGKSLWEYDEKKVAKLLKDMPLSKWSGSSGGIVKFEDNKFWFDISEPAEAFQEELYELTKQICHYRLEEYFEKKASKPKTN